MRKPILFCLICFPFLVNAQTFEWNGGGDGTSWEDSLNWVGGTPPGGNIFHDVIIEGAFNVQVSSTFPIGRIRIKNSRLTISNGYKMTVSQSNTAPGDTLKAVEMIDSEVDIKGQLFIGSTDRDFALSLRNTKFIIYDGAETKILNSVYGLEVLKNSTLTLKLGGLLDIQADSLGVKNNQKIIGQGRIELDVDINGILNNGVFSTCDTLMIEGYGITILTAIENNGSFVNDGYLDINHVNLCGLRNTGSFTNTLGAYMKVYDITLSGLVGSSAVYSSGSFVNDGEIYALVRAEFGFYNEQNTAGFVNNGIALFTGADSLAFVNAGSVSDSSLLVNTGTLNLNVGADVLLNNPYGKVLWSGTGILEGKDGLLNSGRFELNSDSLTFDVAETAIINIGYMHSMGHIHVEASKNGIDNLGEFYNQSEGELLLTSASGSTASFGIRNKLTLENQGIINLNNAIFGVKNEASFVNDGEITINQSTTAFIENYSLDADSSYFQNNGSLFLMQSISPSGYNNVGIWNHSKGSFKSEGSISMNTMWQNTENVRNESYLYFNDSLNIKETREVNIINSGTLESGVDALLNLDFSENFGDYVIDNDGTVILNGHTSLVYYDTYQRNIPLLNNESVFINKGYLWVEGSDEVEGIKNTGIFTNEDTLVLNRVRNIAVDNSGTFVNQLGALFQIDSLVNSIKTGLLFQNDGKMLLNAETNIEVADNNVFSNSGLISMKNGISEAIRLFGTNPTFTNLAGGEIAIDSTEIASILDEDGIKIEAGQLINFGLINLIGTSDAGIRILGGTLTNHDSILVHSTKGMHNFWVENGSLINNGFLSLNGAGESSVSLMNVLSSGSLENNGEILVQDAYNRGIYNLGLFSSTMGSNIHFENNTRNTSSLLYHSNASNPTTYNGNMTSVNSKSCVSFSGAAINNGLIDLRGCGDHALYIISGTNSTTGQMLFDYGSYVGTNEGILEYFSDSVSSILGVNLMTNLGVIVDHENHFRNTKFNDGDALGFPIWNKGLFISPFYGTLSDGIKETVNLNYTEADTLPINTDWYTDRAKTTVAGTWHQTEHYFTPNALANTADSLFLEVYFTGSKPVVLSIPHLQISVCPQPINTKILRTKPDHNWNDHTSWRGNRAPDYCDKVSLTGHEYIYVPASFKAKVNTLEFTPQIGPSRYIDFEYGSVMEVNVLPYE